MITSSSSRRRATVKVKGPKRKAPPTVTRPQESSGKSESVFGGGTYVRPAAPDGWAQRHPVALLFMGVVTAAAALATLLYLIPKSTPSHYYDVEKKTQPTLSALDTSLSRSGSRTTPTDNSFLDTHYRNSTNAGGGGGGGGSGSGSPGSSGSARASSSTGSNMAAASFGDGTVTRKGGGCQVSATGSNNFASALADCVNGR